MKRSDQGLVALHERYFSGRGWRYLRDDGTLEDGPSVRDDVRPSIRVHAIGEPRQFPRAFLHHNRMAGAGEDLYRFRSEQDAVLIHFALLRKPNMQVHALGIYRQSLFLCCPGRFRPANVITHSSTLFFVCLGWGKNAQYAVRTV